MVAGAGGMVAASAPPSLSDRLQPAAVLIMAEDDTDWSTFRPDILGSVSIGHDEGEWTMAIYFTSEAEAREGEKKEPPPDMAAMMKEMDALSVGEPTFLDLTDPWLSSPG